MSDDEHMMCEATHNFSDIPLGYGPQRCVKKFKPGHGATTADPHETADGRWWTMSTQPAPKRTSGPAIIDLVLEDVRQRDALGQRKYGTRLQAHNGRDALRDAYEEALDLAIYLRQALQERDGSGAGRSPYTGPDGKRSRDLGGDSW